MNYTLNKMRFYFFKRSDLPKWQVKINLNVWVEVLVSAGEEFYSSVKGLWINFNPTVKFFLQRYWN